MRWAFALLLVCACDAGGSQPADAGDEPYDPHPALPAWMDDAHVLVSGHDLEDQYDCRDVICRHNENVDMIQWNGAFWLVHRTARSQILGPNSALHVYRSADGKSFAQVALIQAPSDRDLRDPHFYVVGSELFIHAITRLPVNSVRDTGVDSISVATHSPDGVSWAPLQNIGPETWSFWRVKQSNGVYYSAAYEDGDQAVSLFSSTDGLAWTQGAQVYGVAADTPLETELVFMPSGRMLALVRTDGSDAVYLAQQPPISTRVCWATPPYDTFDCPQTLDGVRLDGPLAFFWNNRLFVVARKHILTDTLCHKRTSLYEITGELDGGPIDIHEIGELPSAGDTSYAGYAMLDANRAAVAWYSGDLDRDESWQTAMFDLTDIWLGTIDFSRVP
ncbi:MAG TPA: hypothetical protein VGH28_08040 [Polyangiaceae bacterium]|jgi:hypothetical protein